MVAIEIGRVCKKLMGREAGRYCVVIDVIDEGYTMVTGPRNVTGVKRRKCNILHLEPTDDLLDVKKEASDEDVSKAIAKAGLTGKVTSKAAKPEAAEGEKSAKPKAEKPKRATRTKKKAEQ